LALLVLSASRTPGAVRPLTTALSRRSKVARVEQTLESRDRSCPEACGKSERVFRSRRSHFCVTTWALSRGAKRRRFQRRVSLLSDRWRRCPAEGSRRAGM